MGTAARIGLFAAILALVFGVGALAGGAFGPEGRGEEEVASSSHGASSHGESSPEAASEAAAGSHSSGHSGHGAAGAEHALALAADTHPLGKAAPLRFTVRDGADVVTDFDVTHTKRMHVIVVREDLTTFQHLHPEMADDGTFETPLTLKSPGRYRVFADHETGGAKAAPSATLTVPGRPQPRQIPAPDTTRDLPGGYTVSFTRDGDVISFGVTHGGAEVELDPYLGAAGHLVVLSVDDLEYLHTHPRGDELDFEVEVPQTGTHRMFLQFSHGGTVHTADFTAEL